MRAMVLQYWLLSFRAEPSPSNWSQICRCKLVAFGLGMVELGVGQPEEVDNLGLEQLEVSR